jgi:hypothetical protein
MGQEAKCEVRWGGKVAAGKALLETDDLIFRGDIRLSIPLKSIQAVEAADGVLRVKWPDGAAEFTLGPQAEKWAHKIRNPRTLADKLDVKPGVRVTLIGVPDVLEGRTSDVTVGRAAKDCDLILFGAEKSKDLAKLNSLKKNLKSAGAIWVVYPKGQNEITEIGVLTAGKAAGLVDIKVARFSETHTALKFVIPVAQRAT